MEKPNILTLLPAILGLVAIGVPNVGFLYGGYAIWPFGLIIGDDFADMIEFGKADELVGMPISAVIVVVGAILELLAVLGKLKLGKITWLPGVIMIAGAATYIFGTMGTEILDATPVVLGVACGAVAGIWSLVNAIKAMK